MRFRFDNSRLNPALLLLLLAMGSTANGRTATKKVSTIFADFSECSGLLFVAKDQGFLLSRLSWRGRA